MSSTSNVGGHGASVKSWIACLVIVIGFVLGGVAMIVWNWPMFWIGVAIVVLGSVFARAVHIMDDVSEYGGQGHAGSDPQGSY
ncbi:MAG TPA: HGxxPAAW family protein [Mycobacteriales bacterium]|nr:HGxxPAAW family protein [Mycobacteriales bacterium]